LSFHFEERIEMGLSLLARRELEVVRRVDSGLASINAPMGQRSRGQSHAKSIHVFLSKQTRASITLLPRGHEDPDIQAQSDPEILLSGDHSSATWQDYFLLLQQLIKSN
jgi:hypothetical protein